MKRAERERVKKALDASVALRDIMASLPVRCIEYRAATREVTDPVRREYNRELRKAFTAAAKREMHDQWGKRGVKKHLKNAIKDYNIHHKTPVSYSGNNDFENLVLIDPDLHCLIHKNIDKKRTAIDDTLRLHRQASKRDARSTLRASWRKSMGSILATTAGSSWISHAPRGRYAFPSC